MPLSPLSGEALASLLKGCGALLTGHFLLTSGLHSDHYIEKFRLLERPDLVTRVCAEIVRRFSDERIDAVLGVVMGGTILAFETARQLGCRYLFAEREGGRWTLRRGFRIRPKEHILIVDDIVTTGQTVMGAFQLARGQKAHIVGVAVLVSRGKTPLHLPVRTEVLLHLPLPTYRPDQCPLCRQGLPLERRGSPQKS